jgi:dTDP-4-amino-4,6-dideoxygalactose transaminase
MERKRAQLALFSVIAMAIMLTSAIPSLYAFSNAAQILASAAPSLYVFSNTAQTPTVPQPPNDHRDPPWMANLTDTQRETLKQKMEELKTAGKTPQEIHSAMDDILTQWGIQVPQPPNDHHDPPWMANLTDTQKETLQQKMDELKAAGTSPQEMHSAIDDMLKQWGIQILQPPADRPAPPWMANLTDTQRETLKQKMEELKTAGKTPQEIHSAMDDILTQWGIQVPQPPSDHPNPH